jgi:cytochrome c oxidase assembly protein subunit 15
VAVWLFVALAVWTAWTLLRSGAPRPLLLRAEVLVAMLVAQGAVGYTQYFTGVPALLVGIHVFGAVAVWVSTVSLAVALREPVAVHAFAPVTRQPEAVR